MTRTPGIAAIAIVLAASGAVAQSLTTLSSFQNASWEGVHLYGVNAFTTYVSSAYPVNTNTTIIPSAGQLKADINYGVSASAGWQYHHGERMGASILYTGSYNRSENYSSLSSFGHSLRASGFWNITPKWTLNFSGNAIYQTLAEYLFEPTSLTVTGQSAAGISNVAAAMGAGQFSSAQAASSLTAASAATVQNNPATTLLIGDRVLTYATQASISYQPTSRLTFSLSGVSAAGQNRTGASSNVPAQTFLMPRTIGITAGGSLSYAVSPRTRLGVDIEGGRTSNAYQNAYTVSASGSFGRMMGEHWFLHASGGGSYLDIIDQQSNTTPKTWEMIGSGSLGYALSSQTFLASYNRTSMESGGFAVGVNSHLAGTWNWIPAGAGSRWSISISGGRQELENTGFATLTGWSGSVAWIVHLPEGLLLSTQYAYSNSTGVFLGSQSNISVNSVRLSIGWTPAALQSAVNAASTAMRQQP